MIPGKVTVILSVSMQFKDSVFGDTFNQQIRAGFSLSDVFNGLDWLRHYLTGATESHHGYLR